LSIRLNVLARAAILVVAALLARPPHTEAADKGMLRAALESVRTGDLKRHVFALADDTFEGREAGSRGGRAAAGYLRDEFKRYGLAPAGDGGGYDQSFGDGYRNLLGLIEGGDPQRRDEVVVVSAHFDHVGYGTQRNSYGPIGHIHNGADDNASGTAGLLELAEALGRQEPRPRRSVLIALWDGEEKGLLGSKHWVAQPTLSLDRVELMINLDMIGRLRDNRVELYGTRTGHGLRRLVSGANSANLLMDFTWEMKDNSDHYSFYQHDVPVLMPHTGLHDDYHRPSDDAEKVNLDGMADVVRFVLELTYAAADANSLPEFRQSSRSDAPRHRSALEAELPRLPSRLGVRWDHRQAETNGDVWITGVVSGSPAERGGLRAGDRVAVFGGVPITADVAFAPIVLASPVDVDVDVERGGETVALRLQLDGQPLRLGLSWRADEGEPGTVVVKRVVPGSPAGLAGFRLGDRIYQISGHDFVDNDELIAKVAAAGAPLTLQVERDGRLMNLTVEMPVESPQASATNDALNDPTDGATAIE
jgi:hypothetical protein